MKEERGREERRGGRGREETGRRRERGREE
jgi:hypothetical protein